MKSRRYHKKVGGNTFTRFIKKQSGYYPKSFEQYLLKVTTLLTALSFYALLLCNLLGNNKIKIKPEYINKLTQYVTEYYCQKEQLQQVMKTKNIPYDDIDFFNDTDRINLDGFQTTSQGNSSYEQNNQKKCKRLLDKINEEINKFNTLVEKQGLETTREIHDINLDIKYNFSFLVNLNVDFQKLFGYFKESKDLYNEELKDAFYDKHDYYNAEAIDDFRRHKSSTIVSNYEEIMFPETTSALFNAINQGFVVLTDEKFQILIKSVTQSPRPTTKGFDYGPGITALNQPDENENTVLPTGGKKRKRTTRKRSKTTRKKSKTTRKKSKTTRRK
jgi:hypothetical protein